ncbi:MAG: DNA polymerase III subunit beta [Oscillospiraceae bacterium]|jgi:DNA polymerase-3 subunit beta|nr:DNA polymerase III subunit beta [Oscillospiraceae bacterium]
MKITCSKTDLVETLSVVQRAVSAKSNLAALEGVLLKAENQKLTILGYNMEYGIITSIEAQVEKEGDIVLSAKLFTEIVRKLPFDEVSINVSDTLNTTIQSGNSDFLLTGISGSEFPHLPDIKDPEVVELPLETIKSMIRQTIFAVSDDDSKPTHMGTLFDIKDGEITLVSVDGYRLALRKEKIKQDTEMNFIVPGKALNDVLRLLPDGEDKKLKISYSLHHIKFEIDNYQIISRLLEGEFLDYKASIPETFKTTVSIDTKTFIDSIERVSLMIMDRLKSSVHCMISENQIRLLCQTTIGKAADEISDVKTEGEDVEIGFNSKYMVDALKNAETDEVVIKLDTPISPIKIMPKTGDNFLFLVLPVKLRYS